MRVQIVRAFCVCLGFFVGKHIIGDHAARADRVARADTVMTLSVALHACADVFNTRRDRCPVCVRVCFFLCAV